MDVWGAVFFAFFLAWAVFVIWLVASGSRRIRGAGIRPSAPLPADPITTDLDPATSVMFTGGARVGRMSFSSPLAELELDANRATIRPCVSPAFVRMWFARPSQVWIERAFVREVVPFRLPGDTGIRFVSDDGRYDSIAFFSTFSDPDSGSKILNGFAERGWPVAPPTA